MYHVQVLERDARTVQSSYRQLLLVALSPQLPFLFAQNFKTASSSHGWTLGQHLQQQRCRIDKHEKQLHVNLGRIERGGRGAQGCIAGEKPSQQEPAYATKRKKIGTLWRILVGRQRSEPQDTKLDQVDSVPRLQTLLFMCRDPGHRTEYSEGSWVFSLPAGLSCYLLLDSC